MTSAATTGTDGITITMTATPAAGSRFAGWSGGGCSGTGTCTFTLDAGPQHHRELHRHADADGREGRDRHRVGHDDAGGIDCGATCSAVYDSGTDVTLTPTPADGSAFTGWSGGGCSGTDVHGHARPQRDGHRDLRAAHAHRRHHRVGHGAGEPAASTAAPLLDRRRPGSIVTLTASPAPARRSPAGPAAAPARAVQGHGHGSTTVTATFVIDPSPPTPLADPDEGPDDHEPTRTRHRDDAALDPSRPGPRHPPAQDGDQGVQAHGDVHVQRRRRRDRLPLRAHRPRQEGRLQGCKSPVTFKKLKPGRYTFRVLAVGRAGTDRDPREQDHHDQEMTLGGPAGAGGLPSATFH